MNFVKAMLGVVDGMWSLLTIPALMLAGILLVTYLPIPTLIGMLAWIYYQFWQAAFCARLAGFFSGDPDHIRSRIKHTISALILIAATVVSYGFWIHYIINHDMLCEDWSGRIPGNLPWILQKLVPHNC